MSRMTELENFARELEESYRRHVAAGEAALAREIRQPIEGGLGTVRMRGTGQLAAIDLDQVNLRYTTANALGRQLLAAISAAEQEALRGREQAREASTATRTELRVLSASRRRTREY
ncbi:hypothetical protein [Labedaea rhizosphaerae]|uniref:YbaB/EbfC DNA-binding family protein n=1 Tax=Labedaea rhizosphaerae TaxID=598644 RepID=A0A4R6RXH5_LABRH|nr:hypothetical protein [Labedaea rhizosphaerae]TDP91792.1 hypothetical protein EV186_1081 [Labedaea rhizosphaerae]